MPFILMRNDITKVHADAIVNAANTSLLGGGGVDGAIHKAAGPKLLEECKSIGGCPVGEARITKGYDMPCKFIIHTVGPIWRGGTRYEEAFLHHCYTNSLRLARDHGCKSVAFPLISAGAYGFPKDKALAVAQRAIKDFLKSNDMEVILVLFDKSAFRISKELRLNIQSYIDDKYSEEHYPLECEADMARLNAVSTREYTPERQASARFKKISAPNIDSLKKRLNNKDISFAKKLFGMIDERGMTDPEVYNRANISKQVFSKMRKDEKYHPKKNTVLALAVALKLSLAETNELLSYAGYTLAANDKVDIVVSYFIEKGVYDIFDINDVLFDFDLTLLGSL
ncbi:MAG: macro domain-containing protein [Oscillospiraceae bacterium]